MRWVFVVTTADERPGHVHPGHYYPPLPGGVGVCDDPQAGGNYFFYRHQEIVVRGELGRPPFTAFYLSAGRLVAAAGINDHHTVARARRVMEAGRDISPRQLADPKVDLRRLLA